MAHRSLQGVSDGVTTPPKQIEFDVSAPEAVVAEMTWLEHGGGWITLLPGVEADDLPPVTGGLFSLFSGPRFDVPEGAWMPPDKPGRPVQIGVRHSHAPKALAHVGERGNPLPAGWRKAMDHPRRGLVVEVPASAEHRVVLDWLLSSTILLTRVPLLEGWLAEVHTAR